MKLDSIEFRGGDAKKVSDVVTQGVNTSIAFTSAEMSGDELKVGFDYSAMYAPDESYIRITGKAVFSGKEVKKAFEEWAKSKKISGETGEYMLNAVNYGASMNAVMMAKVFNMAPPIMLPRLAFEVISPKKK